jgi:hypothetical protein
MVCRVFDCCTGADSVGSLHPVRTPRFQNGLLNRVRDCRLVQALQRSLAQARSLVGLCLRNLGQSAQQVFPHWTGVKELTARRRCDTKTCWDRQAGAHQHGEAGRLAANQGHIIAADSVERDYQRHLSMCLPFRFFCEPAPFFYFGSHSLHPLDGLARQSFRRNQSTRR